MIRKLFIIAALIATLIGCDNPPPAYAEIVVYSDPRCCEEPKRGTNGDIVRNKTLIKRMNELYPLPPNLDPKDYHWNHDIPLVCGGRDIPANLTRMHVDAKNCPGNYCQDRVEQMIMCPKSYHK